jgi:hypothetical protein
MAIIADVRQPSPDVITSEAVSFAPAVFSVPPTSFGFMTDIAEDISAPVSGLSFPYILQGVLVSPESNYLEPTIGQIWPRLEGR